MADLHGILIKHLPSASSILEVGCGSGREAAFLLKHGFEVTATDASPLMLEEAAKRHPELAPRLQVAAVPFDSDCSLLRLKFSAILVIALVMHLTDDELKEAINQFRGILIPGGLVILSASMGREEIADQRDPNGRLYIERPPSEIEKLFINGGFKRIASYQNSDSLDRPVKWFTLIFEQSSDKKR
jgi:SAM-dependent methyltransferase